VLELGSEVSATVDKAVFGAFGWRPWFDVRCCVAATGREVPLQSWFEHRTRLGAVEGAAGCGIARAPCISTSAARRSSGLSSWRSLAASEMRGRSKVTVPRTTLVQARQRVINPIFGLSPAQSLLSLEPDESVSVSYKNPSSDSGYLSS
jgi:hypothetical protein